MPRCKKHKEQEMQCPQCIAAKGGKVTAKKYSTEQRREWGAKGGRPKKKP